jgi:hypothetical protein
MELRDSTTVKLERESGRIRGSEEASEGRGRVRRSVCVRGPAPGFTI